MQEQVCEWIICLPKYAATPDKKECLPPSSINCPPSFSLQTKFHVFFKSKYYDFYWSKLCRFFFLFQKTFKIQSKSFWTQSAQHPLWSSLLLPICMYTSCITSVSQLGQPSIIERGEVNQVWEIIEYLHLPLLTIDSLCTRIIWQYWQGRAQPPAPRNYPRIYPKNIPKKY